MRKRIIAAVMTIMAALAMSLVVGVSPAAADDTFDAGGVIECIPQTDPDGAEYFFLSNETNPNRFTVLSRSHGDGEISRDLALTGFTYTVEYEDHARNPGVVTADIAPVQDCTPSPPLTLTVSAVLECRVVNDAAQFVLTVTVNNPDGLDYTISPYDHGTHIVDSGAQIVVSGEYINDRWQHIPFSATAYAVDDCTPVQELTPEFEVWLECVVVGDYAEFRIGSRVVNANGATNIVFDPANNTVVDNVAGTVAVSWTSNTGVSRSESLPYSATTDCTPVQELTPEFSVGLVCTVVNDVEVYNLSNNVVNANGATNIVFDPADGTTVPNQDTTVNVTWTSNQGNDHSDTLTASAVPSCKVPDGDVFAAVAGAAGSPGGMGTLIVLGLLAFFGVQGLLERRRGMIG